MASVPWTSAPPDSAPSALPARPSPAPLPLGSEDAHTQAARGTPGPALEPPCRPGPPHLLSGGLRIYPGPRASGLEFTCTRPSPTWRFQIVPEGPDSWGPPRPSGAPSSGLRAETAWETLPWTRPHTHLWLPGPRRALGPTSKAPWGAVGLQDPLPDPDRALEGPGLFRDPQHLPKPLARSTAQHPAGPAVRPSDSGTHPRPPPHPRVPQAGGAGGHCPPLRPGAGPVRPVCGRQA